MHCSSYFVKLQVHISGKSVFPTKQQRSESAPPSCCFFFEDIATGAFKETALESGRMILLLSFHWQYFGFKKRKILKTDYEAV